ncbi:hypothetical protein EXIGLDRAFT_827907 [Exidia glandulosa HHB12029]|uniref:ADP-ribosylation n=1 Tax=Exidia glandulosa HHB12029 TaxID=1314781 RepID=A0A165QR74_EXIGL|nr:hypothetical protein EXIGLDRAFT_827907 [Exidia glandulosa HHB12029]
MPAFGRIVVLAVLYLALLTNAIPIVENVEGAGLEARGVVRKPTTKPTRPVTTRPKPVPKPKPKPTVVRRPVPKPTTVRRPPTKTPVKRPTPVKTPVKRPTPVKTPVKRPTPVKTPVKTPTPSATACPIRKPGAGKPTTPVKSKPRELLEYAYNKLFKRQREEFVGWHGTNSNTWAVWEGAGYLRKPWSWLDIIRQSRSGGSGADQELGEGVYVTDSLRTAEGFANINAGQSHNNGSYAVTCAIFARDSSEWRTAIPKAWLPDNLIGDSSDRRRHAQYEAYRMQWLERVWDPHYDRVHPSDIVRFAPLDHRRGAPPSQLVIPSTQTTKFFARCVRAGGGVLPRGVPAHDPQFPSEMRTWNIRDRPTC